MRKGIMCGVFSSVILLVSLTGCSGAGATLGSGSAKPYPLDVCLVTDNALGSMGDPVSMVYEGQEVKFCCRPCIKKFKADPEKYLSKLNQKPSQEKAANR